MTSWGRNCGIATYASHLYGDTSLSPHVSAVLAQKHGAALPGEFTDDGRVSRIWGDNFQAMQALAGRLEHGSADALWIQHHPGHFSTPDMHALIQGIRKSSYKTRAITFHSVAEAARGTPAAPSGGPSIAAQIKSQTARVLGGREKLEALRRLQTDVDVVRSQYAKVAIKAAEKARQPRWLPTQ